MNSVRASRAPAAAAALRRHTPASARPDDRGLLDPSGPFLIPAIALVIARVLVAWKIPRGAEDAFITYRYARNLATGLGLTYNAGERVMGFSSPLWTLWNALGYALFHDPLAWSRGTAIVADLVTLAITTTLLGRHASRLAAWCFACFFAVWPFFPAVSQSGLEMSLVLALLALGAALASRRSAWTGPALAALALSRPEGVAAAAVLAFGARRRDVLVAVALVAAGLGALFAYYGSPIPQSLIAKSAVYGTPGPWAGRGWWEWLLPFPLGRWPDLPDTVMMVPLMALFAPAVVVGAVALWHDRHSALARLAAAALVVWLGYAVLGVTFFSWYLAVPLFGFVLLAAVGLPRITRHRAVYASLALLVVGMWTMARFLYSGRAEQDARTFDGVAAFLRSNARPGDTVFLEPIGMIGWSAPVRVVDEVGLVSPRVAARRRDGPGWYTDIVAAEHPEWLVMRYGMVRTGEAFAGAGAPFRSAAERDSVLARYQAVAQGEQNMSDQSLLVWRRR